MAAVGCGVNQYILGFGLQTALDDGLEIFVLDLEFLEGKVVHIDNETVVAVFYLCKDSLQVAELMLVDLDHAQAPVVILIQNGFDTGGFSGTRIAVQKDIVGRAPADKSLGIGDQFLLLQLVADEVIEDHIAGRRYGDQEIVLSRCRVIHRLCRAARTGNRSRCRSCCGVLALSGDVGGAAPSLVDTKCLVEAEHSHAVVPIEVRDDPVHIILVRGLFQILAELLHLLGDTVIVDSLLLADCVIILDHRKNVRFQRLFQRRKIVVKQLFKNTQIILYKMIDRSFIGTCLLGNQGKRSLCHGEQKGQVVMPEILVKTIACRQIQQSVDLVQNTPCQSLFVILSAVKIPAYLCELHQNAVLSDLTIYD